MNNYEELIQTTEQEYSCTVCAKEEKEPALSDEFSGGLIATAIIGILVIALLAIAAHKLEQIKNDMDDIIYLIKKEKEGKALRDAPKPDKDWLCVSCGTWNKPYETCCHNCNCTITENRKKARELK